MGSGYLRVLLMGGPDPPRSLRKAAPGYTVGEEAPSRENSSGIEDILVWWELAPSAVLSLLLFAENRAVADHRATRWRW